MRQTFFFELRRDRNLVAALVIAAGGYSAVMALFWPIMRDNAAAFEQYMSIFPREFLIAFGMEGSLADPGIFFTTYIGSWLWPIIAALVAIVLATRPVAVDLERGFLELPLTTRLSRERYLFAVIGAQAVAMGILAGASILSFWLAASIVGAPYELGRMVVVALLAWAFACAIAAPTTLLGVASLSRALSGGITATILLAMYLANIVAQLEPDLSVLADVSALHYFRPTPLIDHGVLPLAELALFGAFALAAWCLALLAFRRRSLVA